jgi:hypothetical protein
MAKITMITSRRSQLPKRLLKDGWWLESPPARPTVIAFPKRPAPTPGEKRNHLTLVHSRK